jgi:hypothetical protein
LWHGSSVAQMRGQEKHTWHVITITILLWVYGEVEQILNNYIIPLTIITLTCGEDYTISRVFKATQQVRCDFKGNLIEIFIEI